MDLLAAALAGSIVTILVAGMIVALLHEYGGLALRHEHEVTIDQWEIGVSWAICEHCTQPVKVIRRWTALDRNRVERNRAAILRRAS